MGKKKLTLSDISEVADKRANLFLLSCFAVSGILVTLIALVKMIAEMSTNSIISFLVATCVFGIPFGYFIGLKQIVFILKRNSLIKNGNVIIFIDKIVDKQELGNTSDHSDPKEFQIEAEKYSLKTGKMVSIREKRNFNQMKVGDECILCFTTMSNLPFMVYSGSVYELSDELLPKCVDSIDEVI